VSQFPRARPTRQSPTATPRKRPPKRVLTHVFHDAGQRDYAGVRICNECGNLDNHKIHDLMVSSEADVIDRRRVGEATE